MRAAGPTSNARAAARAWSSTRWALLAAALFAVGVPAATVAHMGARFEPQDGQVIHGLGQYVSTFYTDEENWQYVLEYQDAVERVPVIYAAYQAINPLAAQLDTTNLTDIVQNHCHPYSLNLGIYYMDPFGHIDVDAILGGAWDDQITAIAQEVQSLAVPCFVRPGFEFGAGGGMHGDLSGPDFVAIWHRIQSIFDNLGVDNVAWVWNTVNPWTFDYMSYYPGDDAVDWWGINYFTVGQMTDSEAFVLEAAVHNKPVMICESCPIHNGGTENPANWENWFVPYFDAIAQQAHVKAFTYISDPWDRPGFFEDWANSRIDANEYIRANYAAELSGPQYLHLDSARSCDFDYDADVDSDDFAVFADCLAGPDLPDPPPGCHPTHFNAADLDCDTDVDLVDFAVFQRVFTGAGA